MLLVDIDHHERYIMQPLRQLDHAPMKFFEAGASLWQEILFPDHAQPLEVGKQ
jgi:hypothetical protein